MKQLSLILSIIAVIGVVVLFQRIPDPVDARRTTLAPSANGAATMEEEIEVAIVMGRIQRFHQKFWLALRADNQALARFYLHEMEEAMEEIAHAGVWKNEVELGPLMRTYGLSVVEHLEHMLENEGVGATLNEAGLLVNSCNSCHQASGYEMIRIRVPLEHMIPDQDMSSARP